MMVSPSGFKLAASSMEIRDAVQRMWNRGIEPEKVLCPYCLDMSPVPEWKRGRNDMPSHLFGVKVGLASEMVVIPSDGSMAVWEDKEVV